ncbi:MAG: hypothetical protein ACFFCZ_25085 [Promethearchaeota archaeon]
MGQFDGGGDARGIAVSEAYAYVADSEDKLDILQITTSSTPTSSIPTSIPGFEFVYLMLGLLVYVIALVLHRRRVGPYPKSPPR